MVSVLLWRGVGISLAGDSLHSHVSVSLFYRNAFSGNSVSLVCRGDARGGSACV